MLKNTSVIVNNITVFYFIIKVDEPFQGGLVDGNEYSSLFCHEKSNLFVHQAKKRRLVHSFVARHIKITKKLFKA